MANNKERKLKITPKYFTRKWKDAKFPEIRLAGKWLEELGFICGKSVNVITENNRLIIEVIPEPIPELQVIKKPGRRTSAKVIALHKPDQSTTLHA